MRISIFRKAHFNAAHRLHNPAWDDRKNKEVFGDCNNPYFHGHNYELEVRLTGDVDPESGYLYDLNKLKLILQEHVLIRLDHKNLNEQVHEFENLNPTSENICHTIYKWLRAEIEDEFEIGVKLWETPRNYVQYPA